MMNRFVRATATLGLVAVTIVGGITLPTVSVEAQGLGLVQGMVQGATPTHVSPIGHTRHEVHGFVLYIAGTVMRNATLGEIEFIVAEQAEFLGSVDTPFWQITGMSSNSMVFISACRGVSDMLPRARDRWRDGGAVVLPQTALITTPSSTVSEAEVAGDAEVAGSDDGCYGYGYDPAYSCAMEFSVGWITSDRQLYSSVGELTPKL